MLQVVTDSSCDLPVELLRKHSISVVPLIVNIDDELFQEGVTISPKEFYEKMAKSKSLPKTSQPSPSAFADVFTDRSKLGPVICITISSKLSGTYQSACLGRELSGVDVTVFDSLGGSLGHGLQVLKACELAEAGFSADEVVKKLEAYRSKMNILILLNTLDNIVKGGRLSNFQGRIGTFFDIRVLLKNKDGAVVLGEKVRGKKRFIAAAIKTIHELCPDMTGRDIGITQFNNLDDVDVIKQALLEGQYNPRNILVNDMGPTMATYAGEGGMIVSF